MIKPISRDALRLRCFLQLHGSWGKPWTIDGRPNAQLLAAVKQLGVGGVRDALWVRNKPQQAWHQALADAGLALYLNLVISREKYIRADIQYLSTLPYARSVKYLAGYNEPNDAGGDTWPKRTVAGQQALFEAVQEFMPWVIVCGSALKHEHVHDLDADYRAVAAAGLLKWVTPGYLDHHFYPGPVDGPITLEPQRLRAVAGYGAEVGINSETGQTDTQCKDPALKASYAVETYLRAWLLDKVKVTSQYSLTDDSTGLFGLVGKPAYDAVRTLLATPDGGELFPGHIATQVDPTDAGVVVTSEGDRRWTIYLTRNTAADATIVLDDPAELACDLGAYTQARNDRYKIPLDRSMVVAHVRPATG